MICNPDDKLPKIGFGAKRSKICVMRKMGNFMKRPQSPLLLGSVLTAFAQDETAGVEPFC
jgi:hypothetical protein